MNRDHLPVLVIVFIVGLMLVGGALTITYHYGNDPAPTASTTTSTTGAPATTVAFVTPTTVSGPDDGDRYLDDVLGETASAQFQQSIHGDWDCSGLLNVIPYSGIPMYSDREAALLDVSFAVTIATRSTCSTQTLQGIETAVTRARSVPR